MSEQTAHKKTVLLLDDDKFLVEMYSMKFRQEGYEVMAATSVNDALEDLHGGYMPDVVIFDLLMPERDGFSFITALRDEKLAVQALKIALTNQYDDAERQKILDLGADRCIVKASMVPSEVVKAVDEMIAKNQE